MSLVRFVTSRTATGEVKVPSRTVTYRSINQIRMKCGKGRSSGAAMTRMVRVVPSPWPRSTRRATMGYAIKTARQARRTAAASLMQVNTNMAPRTYRSSAWRASVESIGSDHGVYQIDPGGSEGVQHRGELEDLIAPRTELDLAQHQSVVLAGIDEQVDLAALGLGSTANRLTVHQDRRQLTRRGRSRARRHHRRRRHAQRSRARRPGQGARPRSPHAPWRRRRRRPTARWWRSTAERNRGTEPPCTR